VCLGELLNRTLNLVPLAVETGKVADPRFLNGSRVTSQYAMTGSYSKQHAYRNRSRCASSDRIAHWTVRNDLLARSASQRSALRRRFSSTALVRGACQAIPTESCDVLDLRSEQG
jgi:hypothetical protein